MALSTYFSDPTNIFRPTAWLLIAASYAFLFSTVWGIHLIGVVNGLQSVRCLDRNVARIMEEPRNTGQEDTRNHVVLLVNAMKERVEAMRGTVVCIRRLPLVGPYLPLFERSVLRTMDTLQKDKDRLDTL